MLRKYPDTALRMKQDFSILWEFSDDYATDANGSCIHKAGYRKVGDIDWTWLTPATDPEGIWYAYVDFSLAGLEDGATYQFFYHIEDSIGQEAIRGVYYFKVEKP